MSGEQALSVQSVFTPVQSIAWDDGAVIVFTFAGVSGAMTAGFNHTQNNDWLNTVKDSWRNQRSIAITYDDGTNSPFTTSTGANFALFQLFSIAG
jgi:hypothetical protein